MKQIFIFFTVIFISCTQQVKSPALINEFSKLTSPDEVIEFVQSVAESSNSFEYEIFGTSAEGKDLVVLRTKSTKNTDKLRILIFAQQHGNEQSGKEACLLLIQDLANNKLTTLMDNLELWIIPQQNPDGGKRDERRNGNGVDLNRDHVTLTQPENRALHKLFFQFMPHVTVDIHEYNPYQRSWAEFGGYKNFDVQVGVPTNYNVLNEIKSFGLENVLPAIEKDLLKSGYSFQNYIVGPAPNLGRTRHSTVDIDDGRQSFAILNTLSFIYEGLNGKESSLDNLERRAFSQYQAIKALLVYMNENSETVIQLVENARQNLTNSNPGDSVAIRMEHFPDGNPLKLPLISSSTGNDTVALVDNYHPIVKPTLLVSRPKAYLISANDSLLVNFLDFHSVHYDKFNANGHELITAYSIKSIIVSEDEELENRYPNINIEEINSEELTDSYIVVPTNQLHSNFLVTLFEPQSMLGLAQRQGFEYLLKESEIFPILRLEND